MSLDLTARFNPDDTVEILEKKDTANRNKVISLQSFTGALITEYKMSTGLLPLGTRMYLKQDTHEWLLLEIPEMQREVTYNGKKYQAICPWTVILVSIEQAADGTRTIKNTLMFATTGPIVNEATMLYKFPFANVHQDDGRDDEICWGDRNRLTPYNQRYKGLIGLSGMIEMFYAADFNHDLDGKRYKPIKMLKKSPFGGEMREVAIDFTENLFEYTQQRGVFPYEALIKRYTVGELLQLIGRKY